MTPFLALDSETEYLEVLWYGDRVSLIFQEGVGHRGKGWRIAGEEENKGQQVH